MSKKDLEKFLLTNVTRALEIYREITTGQDDLTEETFVKKKLYRDIVGYSQPLSESTNVYCQMEAWVHERDCGLAEDDTLYFIHSEDYWITSDSSHVEIPQDEILKTSKCCVDKFVREFNINVKPNFHMFSLYDA